MEPESPETPEEQLMEVDWTSLNEKDRAELIVRQAVYIETSRKFVHAMAVHSADVRSLLICMLIVLVMSLFSVDNRTTILTLIGVHIIFTLISKLSYSSVLSTLEDLRKSYTQFLREKKKNV